MDSFSLVVAFGAGVVVAKVIDAAWIQPFLAKKEHSSWLREKRLEAYTRLCQNLLAMSLEDSKSLTPFDNYAVAAKSLLLVKDKSLADDIDIHIAKRDRLFRISDGLEKPDPDESPDEIYREVYSDARLLLQCLRTELHAP